MNKKIKNAFSNTYDNISFKSRLERSCYITLKDAGFNVKYEPVSYRLLEPFYTYTINYDQESDSQYKKRLRSGGERGRNLILKKDKIREISYTPDFSFIYNDVEIFIESKGFENDVFPLKKKLFLKYLDDRYKSTGQVSAYFEVFSLKQLKQAIDIINVINKDFVNKNVKQCKYENSKRNTKVNGKQSK